MTNPTSGLHLHADRPPLRVDEGGAVRAYDTLVLADVYAVIAYYLRHRDEVLAYLTRREEEATAQQAKIEAERQRVSPEELLARRSAGEKANAPTGQ